MKREARDKDLLRLRADYAFDLLAVLVYEERGDALYAERGGGARVLVNVELGDSVEPGRLGRERVERGRERAAWRAPLRPAVEQDGPRVRSLDNVTLKRRVGHGLRLGLILTRAARRRVA